MLAVLCVAAAFKRVGNAELSVGVIIFSRKLSAENCNELLVGNGLNVTCVVKGSNL